MTALQITISTPYLTPKQYAELSGTPLRTVNKRIQSGELPADSFSLDPDKVDHSVKYINMVKLYEMAAMSPFVHPRLNSKS